MVIQEEAECRGTAGGLGLLRAGNAREGDDHLRQPPAGPSGVRCVPQYGAGAGRAPARVSSYAPGPTAERDEEVARSRHR